LRLTDPDTRPPRRSILHLGALARILRQRAGEDHGLAGEGTRAGYRLLRLRPQARREQLADRLPLFRHGEKVVDLARHFGTDVAHRLEILDSRLQQRLERPEPPGEGEGGRLAHHPDAEAWITWRSGRVFEASIAARRFRAERSAKRSRLTIWS